MECWDSHGGCQADSCVTHTEPQDLQELQAPSKPSGAGPVTSKQVIKQDSGPGFAFRYRAIHPVESLEDYLLALKGIAWSLDSPIIINSAEDVLSRETWRGRVEPYHHPIAKLDDILPPIASYDHRG